MLREQIQKEINLCDKKIADKKELLKGVARRVNKTLEFLNHDTEEIYNLMSLSSSFREYVYDLDRLYFAKQWLETALKGVKHNE